jgi:eukaryotic-like serine/threonine-protein kinase
MDRPKDYSPGEMVPGTVYRIVRMIGAGGMGTVYDVEDTTVGKRYVLKTLHPELYGRKDLAKRMQAEARTLARLSHPNIVEVVTAGATSDEFRLPFYLMEKLNGQNLRTILNKKGSLDLPHALHIGIDLLDALDNAHDKGVIHRDVKPDNIFLHRNPNGVTTTKLLDFGIMRLLDAAPGATAGRFMGTLRYAAPEQLRGETLPAQTDLYAAGLVIYEMIAGQGPFDELKDSNKIAAAHLSTPPPPFIQFGVVVPETLEKLVRGSLSKDATKRPKDAFTFAAQLRNMKRTLSMEKASESATSRPTEVPVVGPMTEAPSSPNQIRLSPSSGALSEQGAASPVAFAETEQASTRAGAPVARRLESGPPPPLTPTTLVTLGQTTLGMTAPPPMTTAPTVPTLLVHRPENVTPRFPVSAAAVDVERAVDATEASPLGPIDRQAATHSALPPGPPQAAHAQTAARGTERIASPRTEGSTEPMNIVPSGGADWRGPGTLRMNPALAAREGAGAEAGDDPSSQLLALLPTQETSPSRTDDPASNTLSPKSTRPRPFVAIGVGLATTLAMVGAFGVIAWGFSHRSSGSDSAVAPVSEAPPELPPVPAPPSAAAAPVPAPTIPPPLDTAPPSEPSEPAPSTSGPSASTETPTRRVHGRPTGPSRAGPAPAPPAPSTAAPPPPNSVGVKRALPGPGF